MILRKGRYGEFYGCSEYPKCDCTISKKEYRTFEDVQDWNFMKIQDDEEEELRGIERPLLQTPPLSKTSDVIKRIEFLETLKEKRGILNSQQYNELKKLEQQIKFILNQKEKREKEDELIELENPQEQKEESEKIKVFERKEDFPSFSWWEFFLHKDQIELINKNWRKVQEFKKDFFKEFRAKSSYEVLDPLLEETTACLTLAAKEAFNRKIKQFLDRKLSETESVWHSIRYNNWLADQLRYVLGMENFKIGMEKFQDGEREEADERLDKAVNFLNKISPFYKTHYEVLRDENVVEKDVRNEVKKTLKKIEKLRKK